MQPPDDPFLCHNQHTFGQMPTPTTPPGALPAAVLFERVLAVCAPAPDDCSILPAATMIAGLARAELLAACDARPAARSERDRNPGRRPSRRIQLPAGRPVDVLPRLARETGADLVAIAASPVDEPARTLLAAGITVLAVPPLMDPPSWTGRIGVGYDGSRSAAAALTLVRRIAEARRGQVASIDIAYVDNSASDAYESDGDVVSSRREAMIEWWLADLTERVPATVRPRRSVGDPADELTELSRELDLLVIGTRGRAPVRRALTGSVSRSLLATTRCPMLIVPPEIRTRSPWLWRRAAVTRDRAELEMSAATTRM